MKQNRIKVLGTVMVTAIVLSMGCGISGNTTTQNSGTNTASDIGQEEAKKIAFEDAGVQESDTTRLKIERDQDDGVLQYDVKFSVAEKEYDYEINGTDGTIISADIETQMTGNTTAENQTNSSSGSQENTAGTSGINVAVSEEDAKAAALARVNGATEADIRMELEFDDGYYVYEGDIIYQQKEYEFEIDAQTGNFLKWSEERY